MGIGHALKEFLPLYEDGPGDGTWNWNRYELPMAKDVAVWTQTYEILPALSETDTPKGMAEVVMIAVVPAIANAVAHAIGKRFYSLPITSEKDPGGAVMTLSTKQLSLTVNDKAVGPIDVPEAMMMQDFLYEYLNLTGSRMGCGQGICHACTVLLEKDDGALEEMRTCIVGAHWFAGRKVRTVEGHAKRDANGTIIELSPVQQAFIEHFRSSVVIARRAS